MDNSKRGATFNKSPWEIARQNIEARHRSPDGAKRGASKLGQLSRRIAGPSTEPGQ